MPNNECQQWIIFTNKMDATYKMLVLKKVGGVYFNLDMGIYDWPGSQGAVLRFRVFK